MEQLVVDVPVDLVREPLDCINVVGRVERAVHRVGSGDAIATEVAGAVNGSPNGPRVGSLALHDVDLTRVRPLVAGKVIAEHPECWPGAVTLRVLDACL